MLGGVQSLIREVRDECSLVNDELNNSDDFFSYKIYIPVSPN